MKKILIAIVILLNIGLVYGQTDTSKVSTSSDSSSQLLPKKMLITQRMLWGKNGLMRNFKSFRLFESERDREMDIRNTMITTHQYLGYATLACLASECVVGLMLYNGKNVKGFHEGLAGVTNICYFSTAGLALFAPPRQRDEGWSTTNIHKALAMVHLTGMVATNLLAEGDKKLHRAAAITTFTSYLAATIIIKL